jgi:hypothetical protein
MGCYRAWQIIVELFTLFARRVRKVLGHHSLLRCLRFTCMQGFTYQTSMNTGKPVRPIILLTCYIHCT